MYLIVSYFRSQSIPAPTQIIAYRSASKMLVGSPARTVSRPLPQRTQLRVPASLLTQAAAAYAGSSTRALLTKRPPTRSAGSAAALAPSVGTAGLPAACLEGVHVHGSASTPHATSRAVSVPSPAVARNLTLTFVNFRWWMRAPPDALLAYRPGLHCPPRCRRHLLSVRSVCCPSLHVRICPVARRHTLYPCTGSHLSAPRRRARGRRGVHRVATLRTRAPTPSQELSVDCW
jgi:hypothetical protein